MKTKRGNLIKLLLAVFAISSIYLLMTASTDASTTAEWHLDYIMLDGTRYDVQHNGKELFMDKGYPLTADCLMVSIGEQTITLSGAHFDTVTVPFTNAYKKSCGMSNIFRYEINGRRFTAERSTPVCGDPYLTIKDEENGFLALLNGRSNYYTYEDYLNEKKLIETMLPKTTYYIKSFSSKFEGMNTDLPKATTSSWIHPDFLATDFYSFNINAEERTVKMNVITPETNESTEIKGTFDVWGQNDYHDGYSINLDGKLDDNTAFTATAKVSKENGVTDFTLLRDGITFNLTVENFRPYASYYNDRISYGEWELDSFTVNNTVFNVGDEWESVTLTRDFAYLKFFEDGTATIGFDGAYGRGVFTECWTHLSGEIDEHTLEILLSRTFETVLITYDTQTELCIISYRRSGTPYQIALRRKEQ